MADGDVKDDKEAIIEATLLRLTKGIPKRELKLIISESDAIEKELEKDIRVLEAALAGKEADPAATKKILDSILTPMDQSWTAPALLGRLRGELMVPSILTAKPSATPPPAATLPQTSPTDNPQAYLDLAKNPVYLEEQPTSVDLLACWKKIFSSKAAFVFKKAVRPEEAPGYSDRIKFPMDLGLIRKLIVSRKVKCYADLHKYIGLISHNCVKYNGRETDYGMVARNFESMADETILQAVLQQQRKPGGTSASVVPQAVTSGNPKSASAPKSSSATTPTAKTASASPPKPAPNEVPSAKSAKS